jgi:DNA gyrase subunit A
MDVFDLSQVQADYILELQLRRLTRFSRVELEAERDKLLEEIAELELLLGSKQAIRTLVSDELAAVAEKFGTPRRTVLTEAKPSIAGTAAKRSAAVLEVQDTPTRVYLSVTGRIARVDAPAAGTEPVAQRAAPVQRRSKHDAILSALDTTSRTEIGAVTSRGRLIRFSPVDLPVMPQTSIQLAAGVRVADYLALADRKEKVLALVSLESDDPIALGTRDGIVKRVTPGDWANKPDFEIIGLKPRDEVIGAAQGSDEDELVFVASDSQLLRFPAASVRPQGRAAGGMAGMKLSSDATAVFFTSLSPSAADLAVVATIASSSQVLPGTDPGTAKLSDFSEYPPKGRATGGVRSHRFLKGEDTLTLAWVGPAPARAVGAEGSPCALPDSGSRRDASGAPLDAVVTAIGAPIP